MYEEMDICVGIREKRDEDRIKETRKRGEEINYLRRERD